MITAEKSLSAMSVDELRQEHAHWNTIIKAATQWGAALAEADKFRKAAANELARRGHQP